MNVPAAGRTDRAPTTADTTVDRLGLLALGTRLKRLGERLQSDTSSYLAANGIDVPAGSLPILVSLAAQPDATVGEIVADLGTAQPGVTRALAGLVAAGLVTTGRDEKDARRRTARLTTSGEAVLARAEAAVWQPVTAALAHALGDEPRLLLAHLSHLEARLDERPLAARATDARAEAMP